MRFAITHTTRYRYARPVPLGKHVFRLRPRSDGSQRVLEFRARVQPRPRGWSECLDLDGNAVAHAWFDGATDSLTVVGSAAVETLRSNPFDYIVDPAASLVAAPYDPVLHASLAPYRARAEPDESVDRFAAAVRREANGQTVAFLGALCRRISERCRPEVRLEGEPMSPAATLEQGTGACRDLAVLFIDACRSLGLAARFVSGYYCGKTLVEHRYLHAWAEVFVPGGGWRGFDPLQGLAVAQLHVPVAAAAAPAGAAPIDGSLARVGVASTLEVDLQIEPIEPDAPA